MTVDPSANRPGEEPSDDRYRSREYRLNCTDRHVVVVYDTTEDVSFSIEYERDDTCDLEAYR